MADKTPHEDMADELAEMAGLAILPGSAGRTLRKLAIWVRRVGGQHDHLRQRVACLEDKLAEMEGRHG